MPKNQCDGCQAGIPKNEFGHHVMGGMVKPDGTKSTYPNLQSCTAHLYSDCQPGRHQEGRFVIKLGRCYNRYECSKCGVYFDVDSGD